MARTRDRAKGRRGGESEGFPYVPESVMRHPACGTLPHAAFRVLCILVCGKAKHRNGTLACSESYAAQFGITSSDTLARSLRELKERGLIVMTRRVLKLQRYPALWAVTWWPICNRDGQPVEPPEPATHAYANWTHSGHRSDEISASDFSSLRPSGGITPIIGVVGSSHHSDGVRQSPFLHSDHRRNSYISGGGVRAGYPANAPSVLSRAAVFARENPAVTADELAKMCRIAVTDAHRVLQCLQGDSAA